MSIHPGEKKTRKGPTKEMGGEEALEQIGEKKTQDKDTKEKEEEAFKEKETNRIIAAGAAETTLLPFFLFSGCGLASFSFLDNYQYYRIL